MLAYFGSKVMYILFATYDALNEGCVKVSWKV